MKVSKSKHVPDEKTEKIDIKSSKTMHNYFKATPKPFIVEKIDGPEATKAVYVEALKKKLKRSVVDVEEKSENGSEEDVGACCPVLEYENHNKDSKISPGCAGCKEKDAEIAYWKTKYKSTKNQYLKLGLHSAERDLRYEDLLKTKTGFNQRDENTVTAMEENDDVFSSKELKVLMNIDQDKKKDSTFIHQSLEYAYKRDPSVLCNKTLKGKPESVRYLEGGGEVLISKKYPLTPEKVSRIKELFIDRINKCDIDPVSFGERLKDVRVNKLFASGIKNISKKHEDKI